jgi:site-specific recombinase XerC
VVSDQAGLRQGELLTLRWEDVDLKARTVHVRRTAYSSGCCTVAAHGADN